MPVLKPQYLKSINTINQQPQRKTTTMLKIIMLEIAGRKNGEIAEVMGMSEGRVSVIRNSPFYTQQRDVEWGRLKEAVIEKESTSITNDKVKDEARKHALDIIDMYASIVKESDNNFAKISASKELMKRGGFDEDRKKSTIIEISEDRQKRWDEVINYDERNKSERKFKIRIKEEMSLCVSLPTLLTTK